MNRPLSDLKILDFSTLLPGPYATMLLADMGAEVLRVESPTRPDMLKLLPPQIDGASAAHHSINRNKQAIALDLKDPLSVDRVKELIKTYDIVIEQFRPGVMARLGLDYESLVAVNPALIYCSLTGYGQTGPYRDRAGHDINYLAVSGLSSYSGRQSTGPIPLGPQVADLAGGSHHLVMGLLAADIQRRRDGIGQYVDISMTDAAFALHGMTGAAALAVGEDPDFESETLNGGSFYDYYQTRDKRYMAVGGLEPAFIQNLATCLQDPSLLSMINYQDKEAQQAAKAKLTEIFKSRDQEDWCTLFADVDCCVEPVLSLTEASAHPQLQARDMVVTYETASGTPIQQAACPIKFSASTSGKPLPASTKGQQNE